MWKAYFPFARIFGLDIYDKSTHQENRIKIFKGSQADNNFLKEVADYIGDIDVIVDDGSHINEHVIETFNVLFSRLKDGGIYIIEDTQTSYWESYGGDSKDLQNPKTIMNYFKSLTDSLNNQEFLIPGYRQNYFDKKNNFNTFLP
jgi:demethylmacrocin O-methyltransferase